MVRNFKTIKCTCNTPVCPDLCSEYSEVPWGSFIKEPGIKIADNGKKPSVSYNQFINSRINKKQKNR